ncbi:MAG: crossover junction endodeoxyribonuclease RuvC [Spirochaetia bacterium]|nr:crossover junction endodeoxyribonuclease RuvC [Spirochaetia bacterium]
MNKNISPSLSGKDVLPKENNQNLKFFLGIDPGYARLGYGIISFGSDFSRPQYITSGVFETNAKSTESQRLLQMHLNLTSLITRFQITHCAIEQVFLKKNLTTGVQLIQVRGVILLDLEKHQIPYAAVSPTSLKKMITGNGRADKKQIDRMIKKLLYLEEIPGPDDAADGLSLALYAWLNYRNSAMRPK